MASIFTMDYPSVDLKENRRLGYRLPIRAILPAYISSNPYFADFCDSIDTVFDDLVYEKAKGLGELRNMWLENPELERKVQDAEMLTLEDWTIPEREIVAKQLNNLGLELGQSMTLFTDDDLLSLCRFLGLYWFEKGTQAFVDFINYCCGTHFSLSNTWTKDYSEFFVEGDEAIGTPIWEGGDWYPTTHVVFKSEDINTEVRLVTILFNEIANYNLVLYSIEIEDDFVMGGDPTDTDAPQGLTIGIGAIYHEEWHLGMTTTGNYIRDVLGFEGQHLGQMDHVPFYPERKEYEDGEVFGFNELNGGNFTAPFDR